MILFTHKTKRYCNTARYASLVK